MRLLILVLVVLVLGACNTLPTATAPAPPATLSMLPSPTPQLAPFLPALTPELTTGFARDWVGFASNTGAFSISIPEPPSEQVQEVDTSFGRVALHMFVDDIPGTAYSIGYSDYRADALQKARVTDLLAFAVNGAVANVGGSLVSRTFGSLDQVQGVEFKGEISPNTSRPVTGVMRGRMFLRGNRLYQVIVVFSEGQEEQAQVYRFLDSFRFLPQ